MRIQPNQIDQYEDHRSHECMREEIKYGDPWANDRPHPTRIKILKLVEKMIHRYVGQPYRDFEGAVQARWPRVVDGIDVWHLAEYIAGNVKRYRPRYRVVDGFIREVQYPSRRTTKQILIKEHGLSNKKYKEYIINKLRQNRAESRAFYETVREAAELDLRRHNRKMYLKRMEDRFNKRLVKC